MVPFAAPNEQAATSPQQLLLPAPDEGFFKVPCCPQSWQVGALEGRLGAGLSRHPRAVDATDNHADDPPHRLGEGPRPGAGLQPCAGQDPDPSRLSHRAPLQEHTRPTWLYTGVNDVTRQERGDGSVLSEEALALMMGKMSPDLSSHDFVTPPVSCQPLCMD
jgi:hypothetical protein